MREKVYILIVPFRSIFKERVFQPVSETIKNQQYRFELNIRSQQSAHVMGSTTNFEMVNPQKELERLKKPERNQQKELVHHFSARYNMIEFINWTDDIKTQKFQWSLYFRAEKQGRKKQLKAYSTQFYLEGVIRKYQENSSNYKFKQSIYFGKKDVELIFKIFIFDSQSKIEEVKERVINSEIEKLMRSSSMEYIRDDFRSKIVHKTFRVSDGNSDHNKLFISENLTRQKLKFEEMGAFPKMKLLSVKHRPLNDPKKEDDLVCETVSLGVPLKNEQRFATNEEEQEFNQRLSSFIQFNQPSQPKLTLKTMIIILIAMAIFFVISSQFYQGPKRPKKKPKKHKGKTKAQKKQKRQRK